MNRADMLYDLSVVWAMTRDVFPYFDRLPVDWDEAYRAYLDKVLISRETMSAVADFAAMFRSNHRAALLGEATYGSTGTPCRLKLRCGGTVQVVSVGYRLLDGTEFIGTGIAPDADYAD